MNSDLVPPAASSYSQYHNFGSFIPQQIVYVSPSVLPRVLHSDPQSEPKYFAPASDNDSYAVYRPSPEENPQFVDMLPPPEQQDEENYYIGKPRKNKKYSAIDKKEKKSTKTKPGYNVKKNIIKEDSTEAPVNVTSDNESTDESTRKERELKNESEEKSESDSPDYDTIEISAPSSRLDFQMHGKN